MKVIDKHEAKVFCGIFSKDGSHFLTASQGYWNYLKRNCCNYLLFFVDQQIRLYNTTNDDYRLVKNIQAKDVGWSVIDVAFSPDQQHFVYSTWCTSCTWFLFKKN